MDNIPELFGKPGGLTEENAKREIRLCCGITRQYGLTLTEGEIEELVACRAEALSAAGRVEFGGGILPKLMRAFCDSPYLERDCFAGTLAELQEIFYRSKSESMELLSDDELTGIMRSVFDGRAQGSTEYLAGVMDGICRRIKRGEKRAWTGDGNESE